MKEREVCAFSGLCNTYPLPSYSEKHLLQVFSTMYDARRYAMRLKLFLFRWEETAHA